MPISHTHKAVFIHIPKTGGRAVSKLMGIQKDVRFVRDPYTRITSEYAWRMRNHMSAVFQEPVAYRLSFSMYMELLLSRWGNLSDVWNERCHVVPQVEYLTDERINIFRYEDMKAECDVLKRMFGIDRVLEKINASRSLPMHSERTKEITRALYAEDFKRLNYEI